MSIDCKTRQTEDFLQLCKLVKKYGLQDRIVVGSMVRGGCKDIMKASGCDIATFCDAKDVYTYWISVMLFLYPFVRFNNDILMIPHCLETLCTGKLYRESRYRRMILAFVWALTPLLRIANRHMQRRGVPVVYWTVNTRKDLETVRRLNANGIVTDSPKLFKGYLRDSCKH